MRRTASAAEHASARHRADRTPELVPHVRPLRHAHLDRRRRLAFLRSAAILVALLAVAVVSWRLLDDAGAGGGGGGSSGSDDGANLPVTTAGARHAVAVDGDGNVQVSIDVVRSSTAGVPTLRVPARAQFDPVVRLTSVVADGVQVPLGGTLRTDAALQVPDSAAATRVTLAYTATGTWAASVPSSPGRGLVLLTPVQLDGTAAPVRLQVSDSRILNLACGTGVELRVCGSQDGETWVVEELEPGQDVVAQIDLRTSAD